jgi:hypothetical protein
MIIVYIIFILLGIWKAIGLLSLLIEDIADSIIDKKESKILRNLACSCKLNTALRCHNNLIKCKTRLKAWQEYLDHKNSLN